MTENRMSHVSDQWRKTLVPADCTVKQVVHSLEQSGLQIALVVSAEETLIGTITDGDIRRGLLRNLDMTSSSKSIVYTTPVVVPPDFDREMVRELMRANRLHQLPIVDENRRVLGLHVWDDLVAPALRPNLMVIMAGGRGKRLQPYTENCPKPMLPVRGKAMLEHIIERARGEGFTHFVVAIHYLGHMIEDYFGDGSRFQVQIEYLRENSPLGTAGAISLLSPHPACSFLVTNGDVMTDIRYGEMLDFHVRHAATATMAVRPYEWQHPFGVVCTQGIDIVGFEEKPISRSHINAGVYVLEPEAISGLVPGEHCDMPNLFTRLKERAARTIVYPVHEPWLDVGRVEDLRLAQI